MSVLLEALKKAAENKKQSDASGDAVGVQQKEDSISNQDVPSVFSEGLDSSDDKSFSKDNSVEPLPGIRLSSEPDETIIDKPPSIDDLDIPDSAAVESNNLDHHLSTHSNEEILVPVDIVTPEVTNKANLEELPVVTEQGNEVTTPKLSEDETTSKKKKNESDDSFDWSLNQLPGYENNDSIEQTELTPDPLSKGVESNNPILTTNKRFFRSGPTGTFRQVIFGGSSNIAIYLLFSFFTVTVIGFFSIYYFQQQSEQLEQSMRKYKLVRTVLPTEINSANTPVPAQATNEIDDSTQASGESEVIEETSQLQAVTNDTNSSDINPQTIATPQQFKQTAEPEMKSQVQQVHKASIDKATTAPLSQTSKLTITALNQESNMQLAYTALYENELNKAQLLFNQILDVEPENISALNGLAAVYAQTGNESAAVQTYQQVLSVSPNNLHAFEAMVSLLGSALNGSEWKTEILKVLKVHPDSSVLNYALGNMYASESDWKTAQEFYFKASALDQTNADYLVNLAVSLDHLGQYQLAEKNYTSALVHATTQPISFDETQIKQRLITIRQFIGKSGQ